MCVFGWIYKFHLLCFMFLVLFEPCAQVHHVLSQWMKANEAANHQKRLKYSWKWVQGKHTRRPCDSASLVTIVWEETPQNKTSHRPHRQRTHIHSISVSLLCVCNICFGISVNKQIVVLWFQRRFTIRLVLWTRASGRLMETSWLVDLLKMAVLWLELIVT